MRSITCDHCGKTLTDEKNHETKTKRYDSKTEHIKSYNLCDLPTYELCTECFTEIKKIIAKWRWKNKEDLENE